MSLSQNRGHFLFALRRVVRSLARLLIRGGIGFDEFATLAKDVYIESAVRDFDHLRTPSRERIARMTGLSRSQVDYTVNGDGALLPETDRTLRALLTEVLHAWHTLPGYAGPYGIPLELEFANPRNRCFRNLVSNVDSKANPTVALDALLRIGAVARVGDQRLRAVSRSLMLPEVMSPQLIEHYGERMSRLAATMEYNMNPKYTDKRLQRRVSADRGLPIELLPSFEKYARSKGANLLADLDNWLASQSLNDDDADERLETGVNIFLYMEPPAKEDPLASLVTASKSKTSTHG